MWRIPHESELHRRTWLAWPWNSHIWDALDGTSLRAAQGTICELIATILKYEDVALVVPPELRKTLPTACSPTNSSPFELDIIELPYDDIWVRDTLPTFAVKQGELAPIAIDWCFNGWGRRISPYGTYCRDAALGKRVAQVLEAEYIRTSIRAEGGAFRFDGQGLAVVTRSVLLDRHRNPNVNVSQAEESVKRATKCQDICWLPGDWMEPITTGHADAILAFGDNNSALFHWVSDRSSPEFDVCDYNVRCFEDWCFNNNRSYKTIMLPDPDTRTFSATYVNFVHVNGAVIVPVFGGRSSESDAQAAELIRGSFDAAVDVELVNARPLAAAGGGLHCATCHQPLTLMV